MIQAAAHKENSTTVPKRLEFTLVRKDISVFLVFHISYSGKAGRTSGSGQANQSHPEIS